MILSVYSMDKVVDLIYDTMNIYNVDIPYVPTKKYYSNNDIIVSSYSNSRLISSDIVPSSSKSWQYVKKIGQNEAAFERFKKNINPLGAHIELSDSPWISHTKCYWAYVLDISRLEEIASGQNPDELIKYLPPEQQFIHSTIQARSAPIKRDIEVHFAHCHFRCVPNISKLVKEKLNQFSDISSSFY